MSSDEYGVEWQSTQATCPNFASLLRQAHDEIARPPPTPELSSASGSQSSSNSSLNARRPRTRPARRAAPVPSEEQRVHAAKLERMVKYACSVVVNESQVPKTRSPRENATVAPRPRRARGPDSMDVDERPPVARVPRAPSRQEYADVDMQLDAPKLYPRLPDHRPSASTSSARYSTFSASASSSSLQATQHHPPPRATSSKALGMRRAPTLTATSTSSASRTFKPPLAPPKPAPFAPAGFSTSAPVTRVARPPKPEPQPVVLMPKPAAPLKQTVAPEPDDDGGSSDGDTSFGSLGIDIDIIEAVCSQYD